jgi:hypothetical protein
LFLLNAVDSAKLQPSHRESSFFFPGGVGVPSFKPIFVFLISAALSATPGFASRTQHPTSSSQTHRSHKLATRGKSHRVHGQQSIDPQRAAQIQQALIREHYLAGDATGKWDAATVAAMQKYQADQGWQTKLMPDSRALKKLGLGPDYSSALNAKNSTFVDPPPASTIPPTQSSGFVAASGINQ